MMGNKTIILRIFWFCCLILLVSCAPTITKEPRPGISKAQSMSEFVLRKRVQDFLTMKAQGFWGNLVQFYDPPFRHLAPRGNYARRVKIIDPKIRDVEFVSPDKAKVYVRFTIEISGVQYPGEEEIQLWVRKGDTWFYRPGTPGR